MKRFAALFAIAAMFAAVVPAYAIPLCPPGSNFGSLCNITPQNSGSLVGAIIQVLLIIAILMCVFFLIWGGIRWITSGGDKGRIDQARGTIVAAIVGLIISLLAFFITNVILIFITGKGISTMSIPTLL